MAIAKKRGDKWHIYVYIGRDENGKNVRKHITGNTKKEAELKALTYEASKHSTLVSNAPKTTLKSACEVYIESKTNILSPSTIREYRRLTEKAYQSLMDRDIEGITALDLQQEVNNDSAHLSPKSVRNRLFFFTSVIRENIPDFNPKILLPQKQTKKMVIPTEEQIQTILDYFRNTPYYIQISLAIYCGMRRGEICALDKKPTKNTLHINKTVVINDVGVYQIKPCAKTEAGNRDVYIPTPLLNEWKKHKFTQVQPNTITDVFYDAMHKLGMSDIHFHCLRHYYASYLMSRGVPDKYVMERIGHSTDSMLKNIYQHTMISKNKEIDGLIDNMFV